MKRKILVMVFNKVESLEIYLKTKKEKILMQVMWIMLLLTTIIMLKECSKVCLIIMMKRMRVKGYLIRKRNSQLKLIQKKNKPTTYPTFLTK